LDRVTGGHPAVLSRKDGHSVWLNTRALQLVGIDERTPDPPGGASSVTNMVCHWYFVGNSA
jgi:predicted amidohydrolase YtcJ